MIDTHAHLDALDDRRRGRRACARGGRDADPHGRHRRRRLPPRARARGRARRRLRDPRHPPARGQRRDRGRRRRGARRCSRTRRRSARARWASTGSATTRRATRSCGSSPRCSQLAAETRQAGGDPHARRGRRHARRARRLRRHASSCTASRRRICSSRRSSAAGTSRSPATRPSRRRSTCGSPPRRCPPTGSSPRPTAPYLAPQAVRGKRERARLRHAHARRARAGTRRGSARARAADRRERDRSASGSRMNVAPKKALGQHFLVDENILGVIGRLAELEPDDVVLEVGPGLGVLTRYLAARVAHVHAVELDRSLEPHLRDAGDNVDASLGDALATRPARDRTRRDASSSRTCRTTSRRRCSSRASTACRGSSVWCVMVQREVADRLFAVAEHEGIRRRLGARPARRRAHRLPSGLARRSSGRRRTSTPRSSRSGAPGCRDDFAALKQVVAAAFAHRRKTLPNSLELAGSRRASSAAQALAAIGRDAVDARRGARAAGVRRARRTALAMRAPAPGEDQPRARRRPAARTTASTRSLTVYQRVELADRIDARAGAERSRVDGFAGDTLVRGALERARRARRRRAALARADREAASRSPPVSAAAAPTPRRRSGSRTRRSTSRCRRDELHDARRASSAPTSRSSSPTARSSAPATARRSRRSTCRRTTGCCSCCRSGAQKPSTASVYARVRRARRRGRLGRAPRTRCSTRSTRVRRPRDLAALPPNDLASSPLADELRALGAFRADVSGAGPAVYGLFHHRARRARPRSAR